jgi:hypothetical protein
MRVVFEYDSFLLGEDRASAGVLSFIIYNPCSLLGLQPIANQQESAPKKRMFILSIFLFLKPVFLCIS